MPLPPAVTAVVDLGTEVFAGLLRHLEADGSITAAGFSALVRERCRERRLATGEERPEVASLLRIVDELSPLADPRQRFLLLLGARTHADA